VIILDRAVEDVLFGVISLQHEVVGRELRMNAQINTRKVSTRSLRTGRSGPSLIANSAPDIELIPRSRPV
jgi:hypothetical protein